MMRWPSSRRAFWSTLLLAWKISATVLPNLDGRDTFDPLLGRRADNPGWVPEGAPPSKPGETMFEWVDRVIDEDNGNPKFKRDLASDFASQNPNILYEKTPHIASITLNATIERPSGPEVWTFKHSMVDPHCDNGTTANSLVGPVIDLDGNRFEKATMGDIIDIVYRTANKYDTPQGRKKAVSDLVIANINDIKGYSPLCAPPDKPDQSYGEEIHDELRKLLARPETQNVGRYYAMLLSVSVIGGPVIAGVQVGLSHLGDPSNRQTWEQWINNAVAWGMFIFIGTEQSRFAPELQGGPGVLGVAVAGWFKQAGTKTKNLMTGAGGSTGSGLAGMGNNNLAGGGQTTDPGCVDQEMAELGARDWGRTTGELAARMQGQGVPLGDSETANIIPSNACRST